MYIFFYLYIWTLKLIYFFLKIFKTKDQIVFISRQSNKPSLDFIMLREELLQQNKNLKTIFLTKKVEKNIKSVLLNTIMTFRQMYYLATSKICIIDGYNISVSVLKHKKNLKIFQIWHSLSAIKKFGYQSLNTKKSKKIAKIMHMHKNYDYITTGSKEMTKYFKKAFNYPEKNFVPIGLPRIDYIINNEKNIKDNILKTYPNIKNKKIILYAPTFRNENNYKIDKLINEIDLNKYNLIVKLHPNMNYEIKNNKVFTCEKFSAFDLITVADFVITDYSAISVEAAAILKPVFLYTYDIEEYSKNPGLNLDLEKELENCVYKDAKKLYKQLNEKKYDQKIIKKYKEKYIPNKNITKTLAEFILKKGGLL